MSASDEQVKAALDELRACAEQGDHTRAPGLALAAAVAVGTLRKGHEVQEALRAAERLAAEVTPLVGADALRYLPALAAVTEELARCYQQDRQYLRAAEAFARAVDAAGILAASDPDRIFALTELMSSHALALAQADRLEPAYAVASRFVELARGHLPRTLPVLTGGLAFMADLASDLGRPMDAIGHLVEALRLLDAAIDEELPGAGPAGSRVAAQLRATAAAQELELSADVDALAARVEAHR